MRTVSVTCDACNRDVTTTTNCEDYRIVLSSESLPTRPGAVTMLAIQPQIDRARHFCSLACLKKWVLENC